VVLDAPVERAAAHTELIGGGQNVAPMFRQDFANERALGLFQRLRLTAQG